jgi:hypothetical protein
MEPGLTDDPKQFIALLGELEFFHPTDSPQEKSYLIQVFTRMVALLGKPFASETFDFADKTYFEQIYALGDEISGDKQFRKSNAARGSHHGIYINRTFFGLYNLLHQMGAKVNTGQPKKRADLKKAS